MTRRQDNGLTMHEKNGKIHVSLKLSVKRRVLWILMVLLVLVLLLLGSSINEDTRKFILEVLVSLMQFTWFTNNPPKS